MFSPHRYPFKTHFNQNRKVKIKPSIFSSLVLQLLKTPYNSNKSIIKSKLFNLLARADKAHLIIEKKFYFLQDIIARIIHII